MADPTTTPTVHFSAQDYLDAMGGWAYEDLGGQLHVARPVGVTQLLQYERLTEMAGKLTGTRAAEAHRRAFAWILRQAFPWRIRYLGRTDPVREILGLPPDLFQQALVSFFGFVRSQTPPRPDETRGNSATSSSAFSAVGSP